MNSKLLMTIGKKRYPKQEQYHCRYNGWHCSSSHVGKSFKTGIPNNTNNPLLKERHIWLWEQLIAVSRFIWYIIERQFLKLYLKRLESMKFLMPLIITIAASFFGEAQSMHIDALRKSRSLFGCIFQKRNFHTPSQSIMSLKNGTCMPQDKVVSIMKNIMGLAQSNDNKDTRILRALIKKKFTEHSLLSVPLFEKLSTLGFVNDFRAFYNIFHQQTYYHVDISPEVHNVIESAVSIDENDIDLSIIRSPLKGKYIKHPLTLHSQEFNENSDIYSVAWLEKRNIIYFMTGKPEWLAPLEHAKELRLPDEQEEDTLPYIQN